MTFFSALFRRKRPIPFPPPTDESVYRAFAEQASDVLVHIGSDGLATYVSPSVERILGYRPDQVIGTDTLWLLAEQDQAGPRLYQLSSGLCFFAGVGRPS